jgi:thymidylate kinase
MIAFFGPDGAGKSTQAELLVRFLEARGFKVKKAWVRSTHTIAYLLWLVFYKLNLCEDRSGFLNKMKKGFVVSYLNENLYGAVSPITMSPPRLKGRFSYFLWSTVELLGIVPVIILQVYLPLFLGRVVVAERYVIDSIASIAYFLGDADFSRSWQARLLLSFIPKRTVFVFVDADYDTILLRRRFVSGPREYTEFHRRLYFELSRKVGAFHIDSSRESIDEASRKILRFVSMFL